MTDHQDDARVQATGGHYLLIPHQYVKSCLGTKRLTHLNEGIENKALLALLGVVMRRHFD